MHRDDRTPVRGEREKSARKGLSSGRGTSVCLKERQMQDSAFFYVHNWLRTHARNRLAENPQAGGIYTVRHIGGEKARLTPPQNLLYSRIDRRLAANSGAIEPSVPHPEASGPGRSEVGYEYRIEISRASRESADLDGGLARRSTPGFLFYSPDRFGGPARRGEKAL